MKKIMIGLIHIYQKIPGPWHQACRHIPTCSNYAIEAITVHGVLKGSLLSLKRIFKCNPFGTDGYDPVPLKKGNTKMKQRKLGGKFLLLFLIMLSVCGCKRDDMEDIQIVVTNYPNSYIIEKLYGSHATITSLYPDGVNVETYKLTKKVKQESAQKDLFIYTGLVDRERKLAIELLDYNNNLKIIDSSYVLETNYDQDTIWLDPSFMLMMAQNVRLSLQEYVENSYLKKEIDDNYEALKVDISEMDATIRLTIENAKHKTILTSNEGLKYLEKYGLKVYVINANTTEQEKEEIQDLIHQKEITKLFSYKDEEENEEAKKLLDIHANSLESKTIHPMKVLTDEERKNEEDYLSILEKNLDTLNEELYHE